MSVSLLAAGRGLRLSRVFSTAGVHPYDEVTWSLREVRQTNWKTSDDEGGGVLFKRNNTFSTMADYLGDKWSNLDLNQQNKLVEDILALEFLDINENKKEELFYNGWQSQGFTQQELDNLFKESGATKNPKTIFSELNREKGYANYSNKALFKLVEAWENQSATVDKIIEQVYGIKHEEEKGVLPDGIGYRLPYYGDISVLKNALTGEIYSPVGEELILEIARGKQTLTKKATAKPNSQLYKELTKGKINNPTVHIALNQIQVVVNSIIDEMRSKVGDDFKFSDIHLEMARDIINSPKTKEDMQKANQVNEAWNKEIDGLLGHRANRDESRKVKLWYEQQGFNLKKSPKDKANNNVEKAQCIYCGNTIGYTTDSEVDHILPISQTGDDSFTNLVLVCRQCNQEKKNQTPYDAFSNNPKYNYDELIGRAKKIYKNNPKYYRFTEKGNEIAQKLRDNFSASQLNDTRYITRVAKQYLSSLIEENHNIVCMQGKITSSYRHYLGLNDILNTLEENKKDRSDHRHHSLDAITIALISRGLVQKVSGELQGRMTNVARENYLSMQKSQMGEILRGNLQHSLMNWDGFRKQIKESLDSIIPSVKVNHKKQSALYKDTAYGIVLNSEGKPIRDSKSGQYLVKERAAIETLSLGNIKNVICLDYKANPEEPYNPEEDSLRMDIRKHLAKNDFGFEPTSWKAKGEKLSKAQEKELSDLLKSYGESRGIKKVSLKYYSAVKPINQKQKRKDTYSPLLKASITENVANSPFKAYAVDSYKCVDIYQIVAKVDAKTKAETLGYHGNFILYADFAEHKGNRGDISYKSSENFQEILEKDKNKKPKFLMRLHKDDTVVAYQKIDGKDIPFLFAVKALAAVRRRLGLRPLLLSNSKQQDYGIDKIVSLEPESGNDFFALKKVAVL
ncbi:MAG: type II CRISPR RNA-guided endonuclease Cas9, partial [Alphaproteobacteria bacterium]|nr:type II CRISPR RNA-guided endonuclease Cas9 [Alphaproteobacteria bacterium]